MKLHTPLLIALLIIGAVGLSGCSDDTGSTNPQDVTDSDDTDGANPDAEPDLGDVSDIVKEIGDPCQSDSECTSDFCVQFEGLDKGFCSIQCLGNDECPSLEETESGLSFTCEELPIAEGSLEFACIRSDFCYDPDADGQGDGYGFGPGCPNIGIDCDQNNPQINPGAPEKCDSIDHNCNGFIADAVIFESGTRACTIPEYSGTQCAAGQRVCNTLYDEETGFEIGTEITCEPIVDPNTVKERCNGIDDDCDGVSDENDTDISALNQPCSTGATECIDGTIQCNPSEGVLFCESSGGGTGDDQEPDVCDNLDNNCDGTIDENFKNSDGIYNTIGNCGACGIDCVAQLPGDPEALHINATCNISGSAATCGFACRTGYVDADGFDENGCELAPDEATYVAMPDDGGNDSSGCGSINSPCATIAKGIQRAQAQSLTRVRVAGGSYPEPLDVANGISVLGGHSPRTWTRETSVFVTSVTGTMKVDNNITAGFAENITNPTEISGLTLISAPAGPGENSVGFLIHDSDGNLTITDNQIFASNGGAGMSGNTGTSGQSGVDGSPGNPSIYVDNDSDHCRDAGGNTGGGAGSLSCPDLRGSGTISVSGGDGATTDECANFKTEHSDAPDGNGSSPGQGGITATDSKITEQTDDPEIDYDCTTPGGSRVFQTEGTNGGKGDDGTGGSGGTDANGSIAGSSWTGANGGSGVHGAPGSGGGGGGGAPNAPYPNEDRFYIGASGGGAGSGGCAGERGSGGTSGGGSFAIFISGGSAPIIENNLLARGQGGSGGNGGNGGAGGAPGLGADGGPRFVGGGHDVDCVEPGQNGGDGGRGGHGGAGGGGAGGVSFDIALHNVSGSQNYAGTNEFNLEGTVDTAGPGGEGGVSPSVDSSGTPIGNGEDGADGAFGAIVTF